MRHKLPLISFLDIQIWRRKKKTRFSFGAANSIPSSAGDSTPFRLFALVGVDGGNSKETFTVTLLLNKYCLCVVERADMEYD